jgi:putative transposase
VLTVSRQCQLLAVTRSVVYAHKKRQQEEADGLECILLSLLDEEYTRHPFYGSRRMTKHLCGLGHAVNLR